MSESTADDFDGLDPQRAQAVLTETRKLLGELSGTAAYAESETWRDWLDSLSGLPTRELDASSIDL